MECNLINCATGAYIGALDVTQLNVMDTMSLNGKRITQVGAPVDNTDVVNKAYADSAASVNASARLNAEAFLRKFQTEILARSIGSITTTYNVGYDSCATETSVTVPLYTGTYPSMEFDGVTIGTAKMWISIYEVDNTTNPVKLHHASEERSTMTRDAQGKPEWRKAVLVHNVT